MPWHGCLICVLRRDNIWTHIDRQVGANTDAYHTCTQYFGIIFRHIFFFLMLMKEYVLVLGYFLLLHQLKNEGNLTSARVLHLLDLFQHLLSPTKWSYPFWLTNYSKGRKLLSLETLLTCLFQNCVCAKLSSTWFPFII